MIQKARTFAIDAHRKAGCTYGELPFEYHLRSVVHALGECEEHVTAAAWLHDTVEDTETSLHDIRSIFGGKVARLVDCVTDAEGGCRDVRKEGMYEKISSGPAMARRIKLADRIANMTASMENPRMNTIYYNEFPRFISVAGIDTCNDDLTLQCYRLYLVSQQAYHV